MSKYFIVKAWASASEIEEGKAFAEAAGYGVNLDGESPNFTIDTDAKVIFMNGPEGERLYSLAAFKAVINENPVVAEEVVEEAPAVEVDEEASVLVDEDDDLLAGIDFAVLSELGFEDEDDDDDDLVVNGAKTYIEDGDFIVATTSKDVSISKTGYSLDINIS